MKRAWPPASSTHGFDTRPRHELHAGFVCDARVAPLVAAVVQCAVLHWEIGSARAGQEQRNDCMFMTVVTCLAVPDTSNACAQLECGRARHGRSGRLLRQTACRFRRRQAIYFRRKTMARDLTLFVIPYWLLL